MSSVLDSTTKISEYIGECRELGIAVLPPDVNQSDDQFTVTDEGIRFGLGAVKNIGMGFVANLMRERQENGPFAAIEDIMNVQGIKEGTFAKIKDEIVVG